MTKFKKERLADITNNLDSKRIPLNESQRNKMQVNAIYPYFGANNQMGYVNEYIFDEKILCIAEDGGSWGQNEICSYIVNERCWVNNHAHVVTSKDNVILEYLNYYLNFADLNKHISGSTRGKLNKSSLGKIQIPLPPLATQRHIAAILDKADALRRKNQQLLTTYDQLLQSTFLDMFGDPVKNPKGWEKKKIKDIGKVVTGNTPPRKNPKNYGDFIEWIKTDNIKEYSIFPTKAKESLSEEGLSVGRKVPKGSILVTCIAGSLSSIGNCVLTDRDVSFNQQINAIVPLNNSLFVYCLMQYTKQQTQDGSTKGMKKIITKSNFEKLEIINPPIAFQNQFAEMVENIEAQKEKVKQSLQQSEDLFNALVQKAFNGQLGEPV